MDFQRLALVAALLLVSVMLLTDWVQFSKERQLTVAAAPMASATGEPTPARDIEPPPVDTAADVPAPPGEPPRPAHSEPVAPTAPQIRVKTDTLELAISLTGGDIEAVSLPRFPAELDKPLQPFRLLEKTGSNVYVAQSGLVGANGTDSAAGRPRFHSDSALYELGDSADTLDVNLHLDAGNGVRMVKSFRFRRGDHAVTVEYRVENAGTKPWQAALYGQLRRDDRPDPGAQGGALGIQPFIGFATRTPDEPYVKTSFEDIAESPYSAQHPGGWIALVQHYFVSAWIPDAVHSNRIELLRSDSGFNIGRFTGPTVTVSPGSTGVLSAHFYAGPKNQRALSELSPGLELTVDYGWLWWVAQPLFALLSFFATGTLHAFGATIHLGSGTGNWGFAIILLTLMVKAAFFQLSATSYKSMARMRKLQPKMLELRERYGEDRQKLSQETMELYRREKVNPLGGCLPILIQMPVFLALYWVLLESVELRQAPFLAWIHDLSVMDPYFVLPLLMGASMYFQQKLNPPPPDPIQAKVFQFMPIIFTVFFLFFPAGLVLYWLVNNLLSISQQWVITRRIEQQS